MKRFSLSILDICNKNFRRICRWQIKPFRARSVAMLVVLLFGFSSTALAFLQPRDILFFDLVSGTGGAGALFKVNPDTSAKQLVSDFGLGENGLSGYVVNGITVDAGKQVWAIVTQSYPGNASLVTHSHDWNYGALL